MPDTITAEERAAIDAKIAQDGVTRVPAGESGLNEDILWDPKKKRLSYVDAEAAERRKNTGRGRRSSHKVGERRAHQLRLMMQGLSATEVAAKLEIGLAVVYRDAKILGVSFERMQRQGATSRHDPVVADNRQQVKDAYDGKRTVAEISKITGIPDRTVRDHLKALDLEAPRSLGPRDTERTRKAAARRSRVKDMVAEGKTARQIADELSVQITTIYFDCKVLGIKLKRQRRRNTGGDQAAKAKVKSAQKHIETVKDRRRFKAGVPATGEVKRKVSENETRTKYPHSVRQPTEAERVLKDGANNAKIGGDVLVGWLKGAPIFTLTLEERATCPRSCQHWTTCYGNSMDKAHRFAHGPALMERIEAELAEIMDKHERILIRLHVLGDFWSLKYVEFWRRMLFEHEGLHIFGFTAWPQDTEIGSYLAALRGALPSRFWLRHSGTCAPWGSFTIDFPTERKTLGDGIVCPAQLDANEGSPCQKHCGNCAACWSTDRHIIFTEH